MDTVIIKGGKFTTTFDSRELSRGLRKSSRAVRNSMALVECDGAVGRDGVLEAIESQSTIDTASTVQLFPFPQVFDFINVTLVCDQRHIYELRGSSLVLVYTATTYGSLWCAVDFYDYIYLSNGKEAVVRDPGSKTYAVTTELPTAGGMCNYNGQVMLVAPDETTSAALGFWNDDNVMQVSLSDSAYLSYELGWLVTEDEQYYITDEEGKRITVEKGIACG